MNNQTDYLYLKASPMFHFSLHAKELFHSNFLAWLGMDPELREVFRKVLVSALGIEEAIVKSWGDDYEILREKLNLDLIIKAKDKTLKTPKGAKDIPGQWYVVIENKFKSIPTTDQLERYSEIIKKNNSKNTKREKYDNSESVERFLLVPHPIDIVLPDSWKSVTYEKVLQALKESVDIIQNPYKKAIVEDYIGMTECLINILSNQDTSLDSPFLSCPEPELQELRILDLVAKWRTSALANEIASRIGKACHSDYTKQRPLIDYFSEEKEGFELGLQIQGNQYRKVLIAKVDKKDIPEKSKGFLSATRKQFRNQMLKKHADIFENEAIQGEDNLDYCSYAYKDGKTFWYQYTTIKPNATIKQIMDCFADDVRIIDDLVK